MRTILIGLAVSLFVFSACGLTPEDPWDPSEEGEENLRVASFNTHNLFDTHCDSGDCGPNEFEKTPSQSEYEERITEVAEAIEELDSQIVLLQEIENEDVLEDLADELDGHYSVAVLGELGWPGSLDVGVLSTGELEETRGYRDERELERPDGGTDRFTREFLRVDLEIGGRSIIAFTSHFRSKRDDDPERRLAEAREAREIVDEVAHANPDSLVVFGGDLNDRPGSEPLEALTTDNG
ncbi:MAG: endonuclease/exonuclease/phosphatase family protein, partial [Persicimonas sp.]